MKTSVWVMLMLCACMCARMCVYAANAPPFVKVALTATNKNAVCNDGSPATYFYRAGSGSGANIWTIYQEGGGFCYDEPSCAQRWHDTKHFMTSTLLPDVLTDNTTAQDVNHDGINSGDPTANPHFYNANQVYLWYCSSDCHAGNRSGSDTPGGYFFNGKVIVESLFYDLALRYKAFSQANQILLLGFSAGGMATWYNADFVGGLVKSLAPGATYKAYVDSGWPMDLPAYEGIGNMRDGLAMMYINFNVQFDQTCMNSFAAVGEQWRCSFPLYSYPQTTTPIFVAGYQYDMPFIGLGPPTNATQSEYFDIVGKYFLMTTAPMPNLFAPNCYCHGVAAYNTRWNVITVEGSTASDMVWAWFNSTGTYKKQAVDTCLPINCNPTCSCVWYQSQSKLI